MMDDPASGHTSARVKAHGTLPGEGHIGHLNSLRSFQWGSGLNKLTMNNNSQVMNALDVGFMLVFGFSQRKRKLTI